MKTLADLLEDRLGTPIDLVDRGAVGGGCIHDSRRIQTATDSFFVKQAPLSRRPLLETEAAGLQVIADTHTVRTPAVIALGEVGEKFVLVLEWIDLEPLGAKAGARLGHQLAELHRCEQELRFGWDRDNFIGATPQKNSSRDTWPEFFRECRLQPQLALAERNGYPLPSPEPLLENIGAFFPGDSPTAPSPLHGDLWGGNAASDRSGNPVLFDPAFYYGDPETDLAFTHFFGGFPDSFYRNYREDTPERPGWKIRQTLYNLYHVLNHLNLFGSSYGSSARKMIEELNTVARTGSL